MPGMIVRSNKNFRTAGFVVFVLFIILYFARDTGAQDMFTMPVVYKVPGMERVKEYKNLTYKKVKDEELKMDIYTPQGLSKQSRLPAMIFIHGGFLPPNIPLKPKDWGVFISYGRLMAASGLVGVTFNHRYYGWDETHLNTSFQDVSDAIEFVRKHAADYNIDPDRIGLWVFSGAGPHLSIPLKTKMEFVRCIVAYYAIMDLAPFSDSNPNMVNKAQAKKFTPADYLNPDTPAPPIFVARGGKDGATLNKSMTDFINRALETNKTIDVMNHPNGTHGFDILNNDDRSREIIARTIEFVKTRLNNPK